MSTEVLVAGFWHACPILPRSKNCLGITVRAAETLVLAPSTFGAWPSKAPLRIQLPGVPVQTVHPEAASPSFVTTPFHVSLRSVFLPQG